MSQIPVPVNPSIAPLRNVALLTELVHRVVSRSPALPGMATFHGPSGYGKSCAVFYATNKHRAYTVQLGESWTKKYFCLQVAREMGIVAARSTPEIIAQIGDQLAASHRPLLIDEADFLVSRNMVETVREIYERCHGSIILIGEEGLPHALKKWERVHGRMIDWVGAQPATVADAYHLARIHAHGIEIAEDLMTALHEDSKGSARRVCVNLDRVAEEARAQGKAVMTRADYGRDFFTGAPPSRRG